MVFLTDAFVARAAGVHQALRRADLWFEPPSEPLKVTRKEADWQAARRGTIQHEVLEGERAAVFVDGDNLEIRVSCRADAGTSPQQLSASV